MDKKASYTINVINCLAVPMIYYFDFNHIISISLLYEIMTKTVNKLE